MKRFEKFTLSAREEMEVELAVIDVLESKVACEKKSGWSDL